MKKMRYVIAVGCCIAVMLLVFRKESFVHAGTSESKILPEEKATLLVQGISESPAFATIIKNVAPVVNATIKEQLGLPQEYEYEFFLPKKLQRLTVGTCCDMRKNGEALFFSHLESTLKDLDFSLCDVSFAPEVHFFGNQEDELVIMIVDPKKQLTCLNENLKKMMHCADKCYQETYHCALYDCEKSERYSYIPHIGLGRIRLQSIKDRIKDQSKINEVMATLKEQVKKKALEIVEQVFALESRQLCFVKVGVLDQRKKEYLKDYSL